MPAKGKASGGKKKAERGGKPAKKSDRKPVETSAGKSATKGGGPSKGGRPKRIGRMKELLLEKLDELRGGMDSSIEGYHVSSKGGRGDVSDLAADSLDGDTAVQLAASESSEIAQVDAALAKIEEGTYGLCATCGEEIPWVRLEAVPYAVNCVNCKRRQEITGGSEDQASGWSAVDEMEDLENG